LRFVKSKLQTVAINTSTEPEMHQIIAVLYSLVLIIIAALIGATNAAPSITNFTIFIIGHLHRKGSPYRGLLLSSSMRAAIRASYSLRFQVSENPTVSMQIISPHTEHW
jgi:hypothetical protein